MGNCTAKKTGKPINSHNKENQQQETLTPSNIDNFLVKKLTLQEAIKKRETLKQNLKESYLEPPTFKAIKLDVFQQNKLP